MILTNFYIKKKIGSLAKQAPQREHAYLSLEHADNLLLVYSGQDKEAVQKCIDQLRKLNKNINGCVSLCGKASCNNETDHLQIAEKDMDLFMLPKAIVFSQFKSIPGDILIDLSRPDDYVMQYLVLSHPATLKVGRKNNNLCIHDVSILSQEEGVENLFNHIMFYLQTIRSKQLITL